MLRLWVGEELWKGLSRDRPDPREGMMMERHPFCDWTDSFGFDHTSLPIPTSIPTMLKSRSTAGGNDERLVLVISRTHVTITAIWPCIPTRDSFIYCA